MKRPLYSSSFCPLVTSIKVDGIFLLTFDEKLNKKHNKAKRSVKLTIKTGIITATREQYEYCNTLG
jgi:hypothetical protein